MLQQRFRIGQEGAAGLGEADGTPVALQQLRPEVAFECFDLCAERRLRQVYLPGSPAKAECVSNRDKRPYLPDIQRGS